MNDNFLQPANQPGERPAGPPPIFNLPPGVKSLIVLLIVIHLGQRLMPASLDGGLEGTLGFFPYRYWLLLHGQWAGPLFLAVVTPVTYIFLHATWVHLAINIFSLAAFGTAVERLVGARMMLWLFLLCGVCGAFTEFAVNPTATTIVIGASAGISGLFAITLLTMMRGKNLSRRKFWGTLLVVLITIIAMGQPEIRGMTVAWVAHVGGFIAGLAADACLSRRDGNTPMRDLGWIAAIIILPLLVLVTNISKYF